MKNNAVWKKCLKILLLRKMDRVLLLFKKEIKSYFDSPLAYITIIVFLIISGWMFSSTIFLINRVTIENFTANVPLLLMFLAPAIAMQLLAGEFNTGTIEILGSLPIKNSEIIAGKFLAAFSLLASAILLTLIYPISISFLGNIDWGQIAGAYIGMLLIGGTFLAAGIFSSALSSNQVVAFIIGFVFSFALFLAGKVSYILPAYIRPVIDYIGIDSHWENLARGVVDIRDIVYFASLWILFYYGTFVIFSRRVRVGLYKAFSTTLLLGILVVLNIITEALVLRLDLTENNIYSLSKASKKVMKSLDDPVIIKAYFSGNLPLQYQQGRKYLDSLLHEYRAYSNTKLKFKFLDPSDDNIAREARANGIPPLKFTEAGKDKFEIKQGYMGLVILYGDKKEVMPVVENVKGLEYDLTTKIKKITSDIRKTVGYIGKLGISGELRNNIETRYDFTEIISTGSFNESLFSSIIVKAGDEFDDGELGILKEASVKKIPLAIFADNYEIDMETFRTSKIDNKINDFLQAYGLKVGEGLILDRQCQRIGITTRQGFFTIQNIVDYPYFPMVTDLDRDNPIVRELDSIALPFVSPISIDEKKVKDFELSVLARTSRYSRIEKNPGFVSPMREHFSPVDKSTGSFPVICLIKEKKTPFRIILVSNSRLINREYLSTGSNVSLFLNIIDWLTEDHDLISIRSKGVSGRPMKNVTPAKKLFVKNLNIFMMPLLILGIGIYRWKSKDLRNYTMKEKLMS